MRRRVALAVVSLLALAGCADEPGVVEVTVTETASSATPTTSTASSTASSSTSSTTPTGTPPDCSDEALQASPGLQEFQLNGCIGDFARPGVPQTDHVVLVQWTGKHWEIVESDGMWDGLGMSRPCHNRTKLESLGVPEEYIKAEAICGEYAPGEEPPSSQPNWEDASKERYIPYVGMGRRRRNTPLSPRATGAASSSSILSSTTATAPTPSTASRLRCSRRTRLGNRASTPSRASARRYARG